MRFAPRRNWFETGRPAAAALLLLGAAGCADGVGRAAEANGAAQAALAMGDLPTARDALLRAVQARDDDAGYWSSLGAVQLELGSYADAYYAYSRAVELDRSNARALQTLAQIALLSDRVDEAEEFAGQLDLLEPGGAASRTIQGYIALKRGRHEAAIKAADEVLAGAPSDVGAVVLKALALEGSGQQAPAVALLEAFLTSHGQNQVVLQNLLGIHKRRLDGPGTVSALARLSALSPADKPVALEHARALYGIGRTPEARRVTTALVDSGVPPIVLTEILKLWLQNEPRPQALRDARAVRPSDGSQRLALARFFIEAGVPGEAERLLGTDARRPVDGASANPVAVLAHARAAQGRRAEAEAMLGDVLAFDATNIAALRGRTDLYLETGRLDAALPDAQKLVAENPQSPEDRLRLMRVYGSRGDEGLAEQTLWRAFNELPANRLLYGTLRNRLRLAGRSDTLARLEQSYLQQRRDAAKG